MGLWCAIHCFVDDLMVQFARVEKNQWVFVAFTTGLILRRMHTYRFIRGLLPWVCLSTLIYRFFFIDTPENFASIIFDAVRAENASMNRLVGDVGGMIIFFVVVTFVTNILNKKVSNFSKSLMDYGYGLVRTTSYVKAYLKKEQDKIEIEFDRDLKSKSRALGELNTHLPKKGQSSAKILKLMKSATSNEDVAWETGKVSGAVYHGIADHRNLLNKAFAEYSISNPLHSDIWPSVMKFESEIIAMTASLVNGSEDRVCGATTSVRLRLQNTFLNCIGTIYDCPPRDGWY
jgi:hypothetical protein